MEVDYDCRTAARIPSPWLKIPVTAVVLYISTQANAEWVAGPPLWHPGHMHRQPPTPSYITAVTPPNTELILCIIIPVQQGSSVQYYSGLSLGGEWATSQTFITRYPWGGGGSYVDLCLRYEMR